MPLLNPNMMYYYDMIRSSGLSRAIQWDKRIIQRIVTSIALLFFFPAFLSAAPGSGTGTISPDSEVTAGSSGKWTISYTAAEPFSSGTVHLSIPVNWSHPQISNGSTAGYVTVSSEGTLEGVPVVIDGRIIKVYVDTLDTGQKIDIIYGDDSVSSSGNASVQNLVESDVELTLQSDPSGGSVVEIAVSPTIDIVAGPIFRIVFTTPQRSFKADGESAVMRVRTEDQYGNASTVASAQDILLSSTSGTGSFSHLGGGNWSATSSVTISAGEDTVSFYYRDTKVNEPVITASGSGQSWTDAQQQAIVIAGDPVQLLATPEDSTVTAGEYARFLLRITDIHDNPTSASQDQTITLMAGSGSSFYLTGDHGSTINSIVIPSGDSSVEVDYMYTVMNETTGYLLAFFDGDGVLPNLDAFTTLVYIQPAALDAASSQLSVDKYSVTANATDQVVVTVTATDAFGNPVSGGAVLLSATDTGGGNVITQPVGVTGSDGVATGS
ncbi:MAG: Ig-like domain-containing protein, partial [Candidatus Krumholzibacteriota bacterium]|nr:Ig-like domain-containing protein [Candidatus Krumholzibacteriota bacterium]